MHVYFSGLGGVAIGPLALLARDAGYEVSGSDQARSRYTEIIEAAGIEVGYDQTGQYLEEVNNKNKIDWLVFTSALPADHSELVKAKDLGIKATKRADFINQFLSDHNLKLIAVSGTHGKTTTTAMLVWLFKQLKIPVSYSVGTNLPFGPSAHYDSQSEWFVYEADEYDRNMLEFHPDIAVITELDYDHPDTYKDKADYRTAFDKFTQQSKKVFARSDIVADEKIHLPGKHNRTNGTLAVAVVEDIVGSDKQPALIDAINDYPGTERRFEKLAENLYTDYAHHPAEIQATLQLASEIAGDRKIIALYQPHQNIRQHMIADQYKDCFSIAQKVYWLPTYLSREDKSLATLSPQDLINKLATKNAKLVELNADLVNTVKKEIDMGNLVIIMGAGDIDDWARKHFIGNA